MKLLLLLLVTPLAFSDSRYLRKGNRKAASWTTWSTQTTNWNWNSNTAWTNWGGYPRPAPAPAPRPAPPPPAPVPSSGQCGSYMEEQAVILTNQERARRGLSPLGCNTRALQVARNYCQYMCQTNCFDHHCGNTGPGDRLTNGGIRWSSYGENIAYGQEDHASVMRAWINSPGHYANIVKTSVSEVSVGVYNCGGTNYWTQVFFSTSNF